MHSDFEMVLSLCGSWEWTTWGEGVIEDQTKINMQSTGARGVSAANCGEKTLLAFSSWMNPKLLQYNKAEDKWQEYARINCEYVEYRTILKDDNFFFIGGFLHGERSKIVRAFNIRNKTWQNFPAMNQGRSYHCLVELDDKIYAIGGYAGNNALSSVERYTTSDGWKLVKSLTVGRYNASAVTLNGKIYIMGGFNGTKLKSVECYNPDRNTWTSCADMNTSRDLHSAAAHNGRIYVLGSSGVERYDPHQNKWLQICSLNVGQSVTSCVSLENKLWVIGGFSADGTCLSVYDEERNRWEQKCALPGCSILSCFVVPVALLTPNESKC